MRTTVEIKPAHRARLLELAAHRGEKGFSTVVSEALDFFLEMQSARTQAIRNALLLRGSITEKDAASLSARAREIRESWR